MTSLDAAQVYTLARGAGLAHQAALTATAIAQAESGFRTDAVGDTALVDAKWGPSVGLWQVRSLKSQRGTGGVRDESRLADPRFNARAMASISSGGAHWSPWSTYNNGAYRAHMASVTAAVASGKGVGYGPNDPSPKPNRGTNQPVSDWDPLPGGDGLPGYGDDLLGGAGGAVGDQVQRAIVGLFTATALPAAAVGLGVVLICVGAWRAVQ